MFFSKIAIAPFPAKLPRKAVKRTNHFAAGGEFVTLFLRQAVGQMLSHRRAGTYHGTVRGDCDIESLVLRSPLLGHTQTEVVRFGQES